MHVVAFLILLTLICVFGLGRVFKAIAGVILAVMVIGGLILFLVVIGSSH